ncbi:rhomboid-like protein [Streptomyces sp. cg36]|uniref:rhomboid-like protein n=1 Tax=Streptomyces sp. cg36 TaxID=3238798 RepID=UPI0034E2C748
MIVLIGLTTVLAWYLLKWLARHLAIAAMAVSRLTPWTRGVHAWVLSAPATFCYVAVFTCFTLVQTTAPPRLIDVMTAIDSTNLHHLRKNAVQVLATSSFWVADHGSGLSLYIVGFAAAVAYAERRWGTPRLLLIALAGHVLGSLLTEGLLRRAINAGRLPAKLATTTDVGVSYMLVAGLVAAVTALSGRVRAAAAAVLLVFLVTPVLTSRTIWDLGHVLAACCGLAVCLLVRLAGPLRSPGPFRQRGD